MKTRQGFVSNSSTSSFLIFGTSVPYDDTLYTKLTRGEHPEASELTIEVPYEYGSMYIGLSWDEVKDDETGAQFKQRAKDLVLSIYPAAKEFKTLGAAWSDY